jgi:hypothetical protein
LRAGDARRGAQVFLNAPGTPLEGKPTMINRLSFSLALALFVCAFAFHPLAAFAQVAAPASTGISIPWGAWVASGLSSAAYLFASIALYAVGKWAPAWTKSFLSDKVINDAINYAFGAVEGVVKGQQLNVTSTNAVLNAAASYALAYEPAIASWLGSTLRPVILSKLAAQGVVPAAVSAADVSASIVVAK